MKKIGVLTQARLGSSRFPAKILKPITKKYNSLNLLHQRLKQTKYDLTHVFIIPENDYKLSDYFSKNKINYFSGSENDLLDRHLQASIINNFEIIVRITSDCPLVDPRELDKALDLFLKIKKNNFLYISNHTPPENSDYPNGSDIEIFSFECLNYLNKKYISPLDREHVTFPLWDGREIKKVEHLKMKRTDRPEDVDKIRITLDYPEDLIVIKKLASNLDILNSSLRKIENTYIAKNFQEINSHFDSRAGWKSNK